MTLRGRLTPSGDTMGPVKQDGPGTDARTSVEPLGLPPVVTGGLRTMLKHTPEDPWSEQVRRAAIVALEVAATQERAATRTTAYFARTAMSHGVTIAEVCQVLALPVDDVLAMTAPDVAA